VNWDSILRFFGRAICHQLDERTLEVGGVLLPICARDTGIYVGIFSSLLIIFISKHKRASNQIPNITNSLLLLLLMAPMIVDGVSSYVGLYETTNSIRLLTGALFGFALPFLLAPFFALYKGENKSERRIISSTYQLIPPFLIVFVFCIAIYHSFTPYLLTSIILITTIFIWFSLALRAIFIVLFKKNTQFIVYLTIAVFTLTILSIINKNLQKSYELFY
jgi:uncharacterized membrane protein